MTNNYWNNPCELDAELFSWKQIPNWLRLYDFSEEEMNLYLCEQMNRFYHVDYSGDNYIHPEKPFESYQEGINYLQNACEKSIHMTREYDYLSDESLYGTFLRDEKSKDVTNEIVNESDGLRSVIKAVAVACHVYSGFGRHCHLTDNDMIVINDKNLFSSDLGGLRFGPKRDLRKFLKSQVGHAGVDIEDDMYQEIIETEYEM